MRDGYRGHVMTDDYAGYRRRPRSPEWNVYVDGLTRGVGLLRGNKVQPKGKTGRADIALNLINKLYSI